MDDPIERQAAIDLIADLTVNVTIGGRRGFQNYKEEVEKTFAAIRDKYIEALKVLPPAEPEPLTKDGIAISRNLCDSCINNRCIFQYGIVRNRCDFYKGMDTIIELPPAEPDVPERNVGSVCGEVSCCSGNFCPDCGVDMRERRTDDN